MAADTLSVTDNRTGTAYEIPIADGAIRATELRQIKVDEDDFGLMSYDPAFLNTASCRSAITYIDGDRGILRYRGYPIEQLAEQSTYLETAYLLLFGELPTQSELDGWVDEITHHTFVHENMKRLMEAFRYDAHPMGMLISAVAALSTFYPEATQVDDPENRLLQMKRLIAKVPTLAAFAYRHNRGLPYVYPDNDLGFTGNFLSMMFRMAEPRYARGPGARARARGALHPPRRPRAELLGERDARDRLEQGRSLQRARRRGGGALRAAARRRERGRAADARARSATCGTCPAYVERVKAGELPLMGFGHRVYKNYDPRAKIIKETADAVFEVTGRNPLLDVALELERIALEDEYFVSRKLYPNVDFYSGLIYEALGLPTAMFPVMFAIPRTAGWLAQWLEGIVDPEQKIARPRQLYVGRGRARLRPARAPRRRRAGRGLR